MKEQRPRGETHLVRVASGKGRPPCELRFLMWNQAVVPASLGAGEHSVRGCQWVPITQKKGPAPCLLSTQVPRLAQHLQPCSPPTPISCSPSPPPLQSLHEEAGRKSCQKAPSPGRRRPGQVPVCLNQSRKPFKGT